MTAYTFPTRRMLLKDMGKAGLAIIVLGTAACTDAEGEPGTTSTSAGPGTTPAEATTTTTGAATTTTQATSDGFAWERVDLGFVSAYILHRSGESVLVDTGVPGSAAAIAASLTAAGLGWESVGHVVVTHKHPDHQGSLVDVLETAGDAAWYAGVGDIASITAPVDAIAVGDGDQVFGLDIIETPGHTPGHISVLDRAGGILVAGDALNGADDGVVGPNPDFSEDIGMANASVSKLAGFDYEVALFGHGEPMTSGGSAAVAELAATLG